MKRRSSESLDEEEAQDDDFGTGVHATQQQQQEIVRLHGRKQSCRSIAEELDVPRRTVLKYGQVSCRASAIIGFGGVFLLSICMWLSIYH